MVLNKSGLRGTPFFHIFKDQYVDIDFYKMCFTSLLVHFFNSKVKTKAMRNCFFYAITSYAEFRISVITNQRKYTEKNPIYEPT